MRAPRKLYNVFEKISSLTLIVPLSETSFVLVQHAKETKQKPFIQPVFSNPWMFLVKYGQIYLWTSLRASLKFMARA